VETALHISGNHLKLISHEKQVRWHTRWDFRFWLANDTRNYCSTILFDCVSVGLEQIHTWLEFGPFDLSHLGNQTN